MPNINVLTSDGRIKAIDFSPFGGLDGFLSASNGGGGQVNAVELRKVVGWLNKALIMTGNAVAQLPYKITNEVTGEEIENKIAWGGLKAPQTLIYKLSVSLCGGAAYALPKLISGGILDVQYVAPQTITPRYGASGELVGFTRSVNGATQSLARDEVLYFWLPDDTVEVGVAQITPLRNALLPASLIAAMDNSLRQYGERGFIPPTILAAKGMTNPSDVQRTEAWWNAFLRGWTKTVAKIVNAELMTTQVVGAGMDEMRGTYIEMVTQQIKNISASFGIPVSVFISDENSYATLQGDTRNWYSSGTFVTLYQTIEDSLNVQLFSRFGMQFKFMPETLDVFKDDEAAEIASVQMLTSIIATNPQEMLIASSLVGYEISEEQRKQIEALSATQDAVTETPQAVTPTAQSVTLIEQPKAIALPTAEENAIADEMLKWRDFAGKKRKREFEAKAIPAALALQIRNGLRDAVTSEDIDAVFAAAAGELPVIRLARAIENL